MKVYAIIELSKEREVPTIYLNDFTKKMKTNKYIKVDKECPNIKVKITDLVKGKYRIKKVIKKLQKEVPYNLYFYKRII